MSAQGAAPHQVNRVFHVTLAEPQGHKTFTMLVPASTSPAEALASLRARFGAGRVVSVS